MLLLLSHHIHFNSYEFEVGSDIRKKSMLSRSIFESVVSSFGKFNIGNNKYNIILENKLFSEESSENQTKRYKEYFDNYFVNDNNIYVDTSN